jgi:hypothetical protein
MTSLEIFFEIWLKSMKPLNSFICLTFEKYKKQSNILIYWIDIFVKFTKIVKIDNLITQSFVTFETNC